MSGSHLPESYKNLYVKHIREIKPLDFQGDALDALMDMATQAAEQRSSFLADAKAAHEQFLATGKCYDGDEFCAYIKARAAGKKVSKPRLKSWRS